MAHYEAFAVIAERQPGDEQIKRWRDSARSTR
jgi:hypothetical protein